MVSPLLVQAGVLLFILGLLVGWLVGRRCEQPGYYGGVRQVRDIKRKHKIAFKEKLPFISSINQLNFARCECYGVIDAWSDRSHDGGGFGGDFFRTRLTANVFSFIPIFLPVYSNIQLLAGVESS